MLLLCPFVGPFVVGFVKAMYTVTEGDNGEVHANVCVTLISPEGDIGNERIFVEVFNETNPQNIPSGSALASAWVIIVIVLAHFSLYYYV